MARPEGFEPPTTWFEVRYVSIQQRPATSSNTLYPLVIWLKVTISTSNGIR